MTDYTYCEYCKVKIPYIKDKDRYVTCPKCRQHIFVGTEKTYRKGKFDHLTSSTNTIFKRTTNT